MRITLRSQLESARLAYKPKRPSALSPRFALRFDSQTAAVDDQIRSLFSRTCDAKPVSIVSAESIHEAKRLRVGVVLSGGPAPGGHNVIAGLLDALDEAAPGSELLGFLGGPGGLLKAAFTTLDSEKVGQYRNLGGFDIIGSGRTKIATEEDFEKVATTCREVRLDALVIVGGDDSNTNAATLAEYARKVGLPLQVIGVPKTIDGDLKGGAVETSFGFDTACKVYSELIGNIHRDAMSSLKYWHFIKVMGRSASHIALECALQTHPNVALISEEIAAKGTALHEIVESIADSVRSRAAQGDHFGSVLIPEGLIEFIPEMRKLIAELNEVLADAFMEFTALDTFAHRSQFVRERLSPESAGLFNSLPMDIAEQLVLDRDPHGNVQVAQIATEKLLQQLVTLRLQELKEEGRFDGKFSVVTHSFGYEGRCAPPSNFDADYCYALGYSAALLILGGLTGYIVSLRGLTRPAEQWEPGGYPLAAMMGMERRHGKDVPVIRKALVDLAGPVFREFVSHRDTWSYANAYAHPGPIQYFGPPEVSQQPTFTLSLEAGLG